MLIVRSFRSKRVWALGAVALAVVFGGGAAIAASGASSPSASSFLDSVARHLGISTTKLQDATRAAAIDQVNAALKQGLITQAQADRLKAAIQAGGFVPFFGPSFRGGFFGFHGLGFHRPFFFGEKSFAAASYLGLSEAELHAKLESGQSLAQIAKAQGKSVDGLENAILGGAKQQLDQAVANGSLTQAQANQIYDALKSRIGDIVNRTDGGRHPEFGFRSFGRPPSAFRSDGFRLGPTT